MGTSRRRRYFIDRSLQGKYVILTFAMLLLQTMVVVAAIFTPHFMAMQMDLPPVQKAEAARAIVLLHETVWPGVLVSIAALSAFSIIITHKFVGPVYRVKRMIDDILEGNLAARITLRRGDDLQDLADHVNLLAQEMGAFIETLKESYALESEQLRELEQELAANVIDEETGKRRIQQIQANRARIEDLLQKFSP
jgi:methyl-accepting chemotaxis protein